MVGRLHPGVDWVVLANVTLLADCIEELLDSKGARQIVLPADRSPGSTVAHPKMYGKGWWRTGNKKIYLATGEIHLWMGREGEEMVFKEVSGKPIIEEDGEVCGGQLKLYLEHLPS